MDDYKNPKEGKTYISPSLNGFGSNEKSIRIASKVIESPDSYAFGKIKDEIVLRHRKDAKNYISAKFIEDNRGIFVLSIQGYTVATDKPHNASFAFVGDEIRELFDFLKNIQSVPLNTKGKVTISDENLQKLTISNKQAELLLEENQEVFIQVLKSALTKDDIISVGYRKQQLDIFEKLLNDKDYFEKIKTKISESNQKKCSTEGLWQRFFEKNQWIFGYGLGYVFLSGLDDKKLEQVVQGHSIISHGKRVDALMKTNGIISNLCFVEIKTHESELLDRKPYRSGCWAPSKHLSGGVAQVQGTVAAALNTLSSREELFDKEGNPTGEELFIHQPKSYLIIGNLDEFVTAKGVNKDKYRSFELYRKNTANPEIITFDELYKRAKYIVKKNED